MLISGMLIASACAPNEPTAPATASPDATLRPTSTALELERAETEFGNLLRLEAARVIQPEARQGERVSLELTWRLLQPTGRDLRLVVRLVDDGGQTRARHDATIGGQASGTSRWPSQGVGSDSVELPLPASVEPGQYSLALGVTDPASGARIPVSAEAGLPPIRTHYDQLIGAVSVEPAS
jgi:hypothetical protein